MKTRDNKCEVRIYTTEGEDPDQPVVAEYQDSHGRWWLIKRALDGRVSTLGDSPSDLVNVPQQHTVWINACRESSDGKTFQRTIYYRSFKTDHEAGEAAAQNRIACFEHTFTEGEGL